MRRRHVARCRELVDGAAIGYSRGVRKVIVAAPVKQDALNAVVGVNDDLYEPDRHDIVTAASCTTNCLAPVVKVIHEGIGIRRGSITTLHDMTNTQTIVDAPHKDLRRARAASVSLIPTTTGSATAIGVSRNARWSRSTTRTTRARASSMRFRRW
jgi:glyceraldehyde 3-phosphate dehydrogenase